MTTETRVQHWHANTVADEQYNVDVDVRDEDGEIVAIVTGGPRAHLIAAAPDLLAALEAVAHEAAYLPRNIPGNARDHATAIEALCTAAIKQARGE